MTSPTRISGRISRLIAAYVAFAERHHRRILLAFLAFAAAALVCALGLQVQYDLAELLPNGHPAVNALHRIAGRQKSATNLVLILESPDAEANRRLADALRPALQAKVPEVFTEIQWKPDTEIPDHASRWRWLYASKEELLESEALLDRVIAHRKAPLVADLEGDPEAALRDLRARLDSKLPPRNDAPHFAYSEGGVHSLGIMLWRRRDGVAGLGDHETLRVVQKIVESLRPASFHPQMQVRYTGHIPVAIAEQNAIREDISTATVLCAVLVMLAIWLYFRRFRLLLVIGAPAVLGVILALALARFTIHYLNINTAFLISIILGNGINTPIVLLARYGEERRAGRPVSASLAAAAEHTLLGTSTAMLAAGIAYGSLALTSFRGFNQFGLIGGAGMIFVWISSFLLVPPLVIFGESRKPGALTPGNNLWARLFGVFGRAAERRPVIFALLGVALVGAVAIPLRHYSQDPLEWDLRNLRSVETEPGRLWGRMEQMGMGFVGAGYIARTGVLLVDTPDQAEPVAEALRKKDEKLGDARLLHMVRTIDSVLPQQQDEKLVVLNRIREKIDRNRGLMDAAEWRDIEPFRPPEYLRRLKAEDLPRQVLDAFTEVDGQRGRLVGVDAMNYSDWNGHDLHRLADALTVEALGRTWVVASTSTVFGGMLEAIHNDGGPVTLAALFGVVALILIAFGLRGAMPVLLSLGVGLVWLGGVLGLFTIKLNFMNFVALPITIGVGADYAANLWARMREMEYKEIRSVIADTGSAVALCSATTIIGYSSLLLARNQALRSFGLVADIGEVTCLLAALILLPVIASVLQRRRQSPPARVEAA